MKTILMTEEYWANSQFSIARYCGGIKINGIDYIIVNKEGKDVFECSIEAEREGRDCAIPPGEPCDLCRKDFVEYYRKLGRDRFIDILDQNRLVSENEIKEIMKNECKK